MAKGTGYFGNRLHDVDLSAMSRPQFGSPVIMGMTQDTVRWLQQWTWELNAQRGQRR